MKDQLKNKFKWSSPKNVSEQLDMAISVKHNIHWLNGPYISFTLFPRGLHAFYTFLNTGIINYVFVLTALIAHIHIK